LFVEGGEGYQSWAGKVCYRRFTQTQQVRYFVRILERGVFWGGERRS
jgi:hypothetical protein